MLDSRSYSGRERKGLVEERNLAFIHLYTKLNRRPPAEADIQNYFGVTPPTVHSVILGLEKHGLLRRHPGRARTLEVLVPSAQLPELR